MAVTLSPALTASVRDDFARFVMSTGYPCLGARSALRRGGCRVSVYPGLGTGDATAALARDLAAFGRDVRREASMERSRPHAFISFAALFVEPAPGSELRFEAQLWRQLSRLSEADAPNAWAADVSADPDDAHFAFSFARTPYFVIGLHPDSSRLARRFGWPALVFNPHDQFRRLRAEGRFEGLRRAVRARDVALQGDINPNLADVGERSEARQYSGRVTEAAWRCPFHPPRP